jgi:ribonuclease E
MPKAMLVNVTAEEEHRVAIVDDGILDLFEIETLSRENLKGNIFKAVVEGINPALEAAFVNYGGERAAFLPVDEVNFKLYPSRDGKDGGGKGRGARISRHLEKGMEVLVQVVRDSYANKPPTLSTYYSLPGRYLVLMPGADAAGISRKIEDEEQRGRLRRILDELVVPEGFGVIVRTAGTETSSRELQNDLDALLELWKTIQKAGDQARPPALIYQERDLVLRTTRDYFTSDIEEVLIDDEETYRRVKRFFEVHMPDSAARVKHYTGDKPIFSKYNLEDQIERIYKRVVQLKGGGSIAVDQTEALTAVDVNSARSARSASSGDTSLRTNLEAAEEIARQLRLRDIGGLIVIDFIDMESTRHARQVERAFASAMAADKARYDVTRISKLGLLEVSRQRLKPTKSSSSFVDCPTCAGDGSIRSPEAAARSAFRKIQSRVVRGEFSRVKVYLPPDVGLYLLNEKRDDVHRLEMRHKVLVEVILQDHMKPDQFEIEEVRREEEEIGPVITADHVDQAMAEGIMAREARPAEPPAPPPAPPRAPAEEPPARGRRVRKRRRRRRGAEGEPGATAEHPAEAAAGEPAGSPGQQLPLPAEPDDTGPIFSEGPDGEAAPEVAAEGAAATVDSAPPARRRRRRRRRKPRSARSERPGDRPMPGESRPAAAASGAGQPAAAGPSRSPEPTFSRREPIAASPQPLERPRIVEAIDAPDEGDGKKPRRSWWRRAFKG